MPQDRVHPDYSHGLLVHDDDDELVEGTRAFVKQGLASGGTVVVRGPRDRVDMMREVLGVHPRLTYGFDEEAYVAPTDALFAYQRLLAESPDPTAFWVTGPVPLGHDSTRWVPELSPLVFQANVLWSTTRESLGLSPIVVHYEPYTGQAASIDLNDAEVRFGMPVPDFWWSFGDFHGRAKAFAWLLAALAVASTGLLAVAARRAHLEGSERPRNGSLDSALQSNPAGVV